MPQLYAHIPLSNVISQYDFHDGYYILGTDAKRCCACAAALNYYSRSLASHACWQTLATVNCSNSKQGMLCSSILCTAVLYVHNTVA
jgi:hypothetical protein